MSPLTYVKGTADEALCRQPNDGAVLLLSDLHIDQMEDAKLARLTSLLEKDFRHASAILVVGDLADDVGQDTVRRHLEQHAKGFFKALAAHRERGTDLLYVPGNHDVFFREHPLDWEVFPMRSTCGETPVTVEHLGKRLLLSHGDEYDPVQQMAETKDIVDFVGTPGLSDVLERLYAMERSVYKALGTVARGTEPWLPKLSRHLMWLKDLSEIPLTNPMFFMWRWQMAARSLITEHSADAVIMGHNHAPTVVPVKSGLYINTGDWLQHAVVTWLEDWGVFQQDLARKDVYASEPWPVG